MLMCMSMYCTVPPVEDVYIYVHICIYACALVMCVRVVTLLQYNIMDTVYVPMCM